MKPRIHQTIVARAVIVRRGKILLTRMKDKAWYFLPGGHVDVGERVEDALRRELKEELGVRAERLTFLGVHDNHFNPTKQDREHELGVVFLVKTDRVPSRVLEPHITTEWVEMSTLPRIHLLPRGVGAAIAQALRTKRPFWMVRGR